MKRVVVIIISLFISVPFCVIARPLGQKGELPLSAYWDGLSHSENTFDQSVSDFWVNIRDSFRETGNTTSKNGQSIQELFCSAQSKVMHVLDQIRNWLLYLFRKLKSIAVQPLSKESTPKGEISISQLKNVLRDMVNTSVADVKEQAKLVSQNAKDTLRDVATTTMDDTRKQVQLVANKMEELLQKTADIQIGATQKLGGPTLDVPTVPENFTKHHIVPEKKEELKERGANQSHRKHLFKKSFKASEQSVDDSSEKFDELLEYQVGKYDRALPAIPSQAPYYPSTVFQYPTQQTSPMIPMQQIPVAASVYQPGPQLSAVAMQMQASAMAMQAQASALMMQAQQQQVPMVPTAVQPTTRDATKQEKIHQCMSCIQRVFREGESAVQRLLLLIDLEFDLLECLLANNTGQTVDRALQERNRAMRNSLAVVASAYDNLMDLATMYNNDDTGARLYHYYVRKSKRATQTVISKNKKQFLMRIMYILEHYYEMIEKMQRASSVAGRDLS